MPSPGSMPRPSSASRFPCPLPYTSRMHANASLSAMVAWLDEQLDVAKYAVTEPDSNGLLFSSPAGDGVSKFAVAVNTSLTTIVGAAKSGANLLVVHHTSWPGIDLHLRDEKFAALGRRGSRCTARTPRSIARRASATAGCSPRCSASRLTARSASSPAVMRASSARCGGTFAELIQRASRELRRRGRGAPTREDLRPRRDHDRRRRQHGRPRRGAPRSAPTRTSPARAACTRGCSPRRPA